MLRPRLSCSSWRPPVCFVTTEEGYPARFITPGEGSMTSMDAIEIRHHDRFMNLSVYLLLIFPLAFRMSFSNLLLSFPLSLPIVASVAIAPAFSIIAPCAVLARTLLPHACVPPFHHRLRFKNHLASVKPNNGFAPDIDLCCARPSTEITSPVPRFAVGAAAGTIILRTRLTYCSVTFVD